MYVCVCVCVYICVYIYIYIHTLTLINDILSWKEPDLAWHVGRSTTGIIVIMTKPDVIVSIRNNELLCTMVYNILTILVYSTVY